MPSINADDAGLEESIDSGILECYKSKKINSVSIVVNGNNFISMMSELNRTRIKTKLHICLVGEEKAILKHELITDNEGYFLKRNHLLVKSLIHPHKVGLEITRETNAQIRKLQEIYAGRLQSVDSHQHIHLFPTIAPHIIKLAKANKLSVRTLKFPFVLKRKSSLLLFFCVKYFNLLCFVNGVKTHCAVGFEFSGRFSEEIIQAYWNKNDFDEIYLHPGNSSNRAISKYGHWHYAWEQEKMALLKSRIELK